MIDETRANTPTVYVVDDEPGIRDALRLLFHSVGHEVRTFATAAEFLDASLGEMWGCVVSDLRMPLVSGMDLLDTLRTRGCRLPVIIISGHGDIRLAVRALKSGAVDFVEKPFRDQDLLDAVNAALRTCQFKSASTSDHGAGDGRLELLSVREREVLRLVITGIPNKLIGRQLGVSTRTVEAHRARLMEKLQVGSIAELVSVAIRSGIKTSADDGELGIHRSRIR